MIYQSVPVRWLVTGLLDAMNVSVEQVNAGWNDWLSRTARNK